MKVAIYVDTGSGYQQVDLFQDERIELNMSVKNVNDLAKLRTEFTQSFSLPASPNNNAVFGYWYNSAVQGGFNANLRIPAYIEVMGIPFRFGKVQFEGSKLKFGSADSYQVTFYGQGVVLSDLFGDDMLSSLPLSDWDIPYSDTELNNRLGKDSDVFFPLINSRTFMEYGTGSPNGLDNDMSSISKSDFKPAIKVKKIIEAIQSKYGFTFSDDFFGRPLFYNLSLWLSRDAGVFKVQSEPKKIDFNAKASTKTVNFYAYDPVYGIQQLISSLTESTTDTFYEFDTAADTFKYILPVTIDYNPTIYQFPLVTYVVGQSSSAVYFNVIIDPTINTIPYKLQVKRLDGTIYDERDGLFGLTESSFAIVGNGENINTEYEFYVISYSGSLTFTAELKNARNVGGWTGNLNTAQTKWFNIGRQNTATAPSQSTGSPYVTIADHVPQMKVKDFMVGLINLYNLVILPTGENSYYVNTLNDWYAEGDTIDVSQYVDIAEVEMKRPEVKKLIHFKYQKPVAILNAEYFNNYAIGYGDLKAEFDVTADSLEVENGFEIMMFERLLNQDTGNLTNIQVGFAIDRNLTAIKTAPLLFMNAQGAQYIDPIYIPDLTPSINLYPTHFPSTENILWSSDYVTDSINYGNDVSTYYYQPINATLFAKYWQQQIANIYNPVTRVISIPAWLNIPTITQLSLNDRLIIGDQKYRISSIKEELTEGKAELELFTDTFTSLTDGDTVPANKIPVYFELPSAEVKFTIQFSTLYDWTSTITGAFITTDRSSGKKGNNYLQAELTENTTGSFRNGKITIAVNGVDYEISIHQL